MQQERGRTADPCWWPAHQVAKAIARRELSAREYLAALRDRVERFNPHLNLVVGLDPRAEERALEADEATVRGDPLPALHGVAMTVKDCLATVGMRTTGGVTELAGYVPREDAAAVASVRRAGANVYGKTNLPAGSVDVQAYNEIFGFSRNPWNPRFSTSGSSGGAAGAVAAGFTPLEIGSDVAGSIRLPAGHCGVFGHKPSYGLIPLQGHVPPSPYRPMEADISVVGPIARCVDDLEIALGAMVAPHAWDEPAWRLSLPPARPLRRVATWLDDDYCPVDPEVRSALEHAAERLAADGVVVEAARPSGVRLETSDRVFARLIAGVAAPLYSADEVEDIAAGRASTGPELGADHVAQRYRDWAEAKDRRLRLRACWRQFFDRYDAILLPVAPNLAIPHDHAPMAERRVTVGSTTRPYWDQTTWAGLTGVVYLPSTVVPVRLDSRGTPIGIAVAGPYLHDLTTLALARRLAAVLDPIGHPDERGWDGADARDASRLVGRPS